MVQNLIPEHATHFEALLAAHAIHDHVSVDPNEVFRVQDRVFVLAGGVYNLHSKVLVTVPNDLAERVLDRGIVGVDEVAVDVLHC